MFPNALKRQKSSELSPRIEDLGNIYLANAPDCICFVHIDDTTDYYKYKIVYANKLFEEVCGYNEYLLDTFFVTEERAQVVSKLEYLVQTKQKR